MKTIKYIYGIFFSLFIIVGLCLLIFGFVKLAQFKLAKVVDATVITAEYDYENNQINVSFEYEINGEYFTTSQKFTEIKYLDGKLPYYEGLNTKIHINDKNQVVLYGKNEIIITIGGALFFFVGFGFLYFFILRKKSFFDIAYDYEKAMVSPNAISDKVAKYEAIADELSKLPANNTKRIIGESNVWKNRIIDRVKSFTIIQNIVLSLILIGIILVYWIVLNFGAFGIFCGLFTFGFGGLLLKGIYNFYIKILVKLGKFSKKKLATIKICVFESEASYQTSDLSRKYTIFKKFRVVATIDGKRSVGYIYGNVPPPKDSVIKVLVRPHNIRKFIIDNTAE